MCAQFRSHSRENVDRSRVSGGASPGALVVVSPVQQDMQRALEEAQRRYSTALETVNEQRVVIEMLEEMIAMKVPCEKLKADSSAQTQLCGGTNDLPFEDVFLKRLEVLRWKTRRQAAQRCYEAQLRALRSELQMLSAAAEDIAPHGVAMVGIARPGRPSMYGVPDE